MIAVSMSSSESDLNTPPNSPVLPYSRPSQVFRRLSESEKRSRNWKPIIASPLHVYTDPSLLPATIPSSESPSSPFQQERPLTLDMEFMSTRFLTNRSNIPEEIDMDREEEYMNCGPWADDCYEVSLDEFPIVPPRPAPSASMTRVSEHGVDRRPRTTPPASSITSLPLAKSNNF